MPTNIVPSFRLYKWNGYRTAQPKLMNFNTEEFNYNLSTHLDFGKYLTTITDS